MKIKQISGAWKFLLVVILFYLVLLFINFNLFNASLNFFYNILLKILPILVLVFVLMSFTNYFISPDFILKHLKEKRIKKWFYVIIGGILSTGPIYMWYPLLAGLKEKGLSYGLIACFLYNRAIKIPLLPVMILYFSWKYIIILIVVMIFMSVIQGMIINKLIRDKK